MVFERLNICQIRPKCAFLLHVKWSNLAVWAWRKHFWVLEVSYSNINGMIWNSLVKVLGLLDHGKSSHHFLVRFVSRFTLPSQSEFYRYFGISRARVGIALQSALASCLQKFLQFPRFFAPGYSFRRSSWVAKFSNALHVHCATSTTFRLYSIW